MNPDTRKYNETQWPSDEEICHKLAVEINRGLPNAMNKIWHAHPVWFIDGNPIVGYGKLKNCIRLMFWSGQSFETDGLKKTGSFKAAEIRFTSVEDIDPKQLARWLKESMLVQWDYKNIVKRKGRLDRLL
ncbi:DUF1801 domain-containing protein [Reinekea sp.]|jgi:hypothetical protein|uniref:DUF1801 domain-containing protein n=1 Tax=Reinekea sp. TaxID=1970455 RepID=UPI00398A006C